MIHATGWLRWLNAYAYIGLLVLAGFWMMDGVTEYRPRPLERSTAPAAQVNHSEPGRVFVLLLDSLRYETAISPDMMPNLSALRARAVWAEVKPSYNAVTVPCLRAAFTGRDEVSVLSFISNFIHQDAAVESLFSQMAERGQHTAVYSDGAFAVFGPAINPSFTTEKVLHTPGVESYDDEAVGLALKRFRQGTEQIVIVHVRYTDYAAHQYGVGHENYVRDFRRADKLVALADASLGPQDTLVVMGDHGHDLDGSHSLGQPVATFALYRGPQFRSDYNLGTIDITSHRWLFSQVLGLQVPAESCLGGHFPAAFRETTTAVELTATANRPAAGPGAVALWIYVSMLAVLGAGLLWPELAPWIQTRGASALVWLAFVPALLPLPWNGWVGTAVSVTLGAWLMRTARRRDRALALAAVAGAYAWHGWGSVLAVLRTSMEKITHEQLVVAWVVVGIALALVATRANRRWSLMGVGGAVGFLALPTNSRYGFAGMMVPFLWLWLVTYAASLIREGRLNSVKEVAVAIGFLVAIFGFSEAFAGIDAQHHIFRHFVSLISFAPLNPETLLERAVVAKAVLFFAAWPRRWTLAALIVVLMAMLQAVEWRVWAPSGVESVVIMALLGGGWMMARRRDEEVAHALLLGLLLFLFAYCVRPVRESYLWAECMLAAIVLAARWIRRFPQSENVRADYVALGVVALLATGFFTVSWSIERLEWSRIYTWFPAKLVEAWAVVLVPWIVAKTILPLLIARVAMQRELRGHTTWPGESMMRLIGFKVLTLLLILTGIGASGTVSNVYLEGVQQLAVLLILSVGVFGEKPRQLPTPGRENEEQCGIPKIEQDNGELLQL